jgi:hypothetical protein
VRVEKSEDDENYRIVNHGGQMLTPFALTPSKEKWKMKVKSFGDVTPTSNGVKKKRGRPSKASLTSPSFVSSIIGIRKESPAKASDPPEVTVIQLHKKRGRPSKNSFSAEKSPQPGVTVIPVTKKRGRPSKKSIITSKKPSPQVC